MTRRAGGTCESCGLTLPPGAAHFDADSCVAALRHALEEASRCSSCGKGLRCPSCVVATYGKAILGAATEKVRQQGVAGAFRFLEGRAGGAPGEGPAPPPEDGPAGKRFVP